MLLPATQMRTGMIIEHQGDLHRILELIHITPGNKRGFVQTKLRNLRTGLQTEYKFRSEDKVTKVILEQLEMEYLYQSDAEYCFMNTATYEQIILPRDLLGESVLYLTPNLKLQVNFYDGNPVGITLPKTVDLEVVETPPGMKTATVTGEMKPATLTTGLVVRVPSFIEPGDIIRVDTGTGEYVSRARGE